MLIWNGARSQTDKFQLHICLGCFCRIRGNSADFGSLRQAARLTGLTIEMNNMAVLEIVSEFWAWSGVDAEELVVSNDFGNLILKDADNKFWRLCPEDVYCTVVADSIEAYNKLIQNEEFLEDWHMIAMVSQAKAALGELGEGEKFCLKVPGILGGDYLGKNVIKASLEDILQSSGRLGQHIKDQADGAKINLADVDYLSEY